MEGEVVRSDSARAMRRADKNAHSLRKKVLAVDGEANGNLHVKGSLESPFWRFIKRRSLLQLLLAGGIVWLFFMLLVLVMIVLSCESAMHSPSGNGQCKKNSRIFILLDTLGLLSKPVHRCAIPVLDDPDSITIPPHMEYDSLLQNLSYVINDKALESNPSLVPLFGGYLNWRKREERFQLKPAMKMAISV